MYQWGCCSLAPHEQPICFRSDTYSGARVDFSACAHSQARRAKPNIFIYKNTRLTPAAIFLQRARCIYSRRIFYFRMSAPQYAASDSRAAFLGNSLISRSPVFRKTWCGGTFIFMAAAIHPRRAENQRPIFTRSHIHQV
jgi:hypothetical protein